MLINCNKYLKHTMYVHTYICLHAYAQVHVCTHWYTYMLTY